MPSTDRDPDPLPRPADPIDKASGLAEETAANDLGGGPPFIPFWLRRKTVHSEQTKLLATAISNLGVAFLVTGIITPLVGYLREPTIVSGPESIVIALVWLLSGTIIHLVARLILTGLEP